MSSGPTLVKVIASWMFSTEPLPVFFVNRFIGNLTDLTHMPLDKISAISHTTSSNAFSRMKSFVFKFVINGPIDNKAVLIEVMAWCRRGWQSITWTKADQVHRHIYAALRGDELTDYTLVTSACWWYLNQYQFMWWRYMGHQCCVNTVIGIGPSLHWKTKESATLFMLSAKCGLFIQTSYHPRHGRCTGHRAISI